MADTISYGTPTLLQQKSRLLADLAATNAEVTQLADKHDAAQLVILPLYARIATNLARMRAISDDPCNQKKGLFAWLDRRLTETAAQQVQQLSNECRGFFDTITAAAGVKHGFTGSNFQHFLPKADGTPVPQALTVWSDSLSKKRRECDRLKRQIAAIDRLLNGQTKQLEANRRAAQRAAELELLKAKAASVDGTARDLADAIKKKLDRQPGCPYCGEDLGPQPHADHIYPLSKGGHSVIANMVMVCAECNIKKGSMTLRAFAIKYGLNRAAIEHRLHELGKDF